MIQKVRFDTLFTFLYSKRTGTKAAKMEGQVDEKEKHRRFEELLKIQNKISNEINSLYIGRIEKVLVEGPSKNNPDILTGRTGGNKVVNFACDRLYIGSFINIKIKKANTWSLFGEVYL
ncbi:tRNA-2-methylthio-N(6)-dimethylallyladenosine synthase [bioreactor metagenome]|uniref:tRNA-2-methylthio-N(6)-dimethylallyladenosine synthase n=1 Tax=bioreactor metagenome TaxID=1076179 RepID=A0A645GVX9_9ZZZZ